MSLKTKKLGSSFVKEISLIILKEIKDPKIKFVTLTACDVTGDLSFAKVYFNMLNNEYKDEMTGILNKASSFIEMELSKVLELRKMPKISFHWDESIEYGQRIEEKLKEIKEKDA